VMAQPGSLRMTNAYPPRAYVARAVAARAEHSRVSEEDDMIGWAITFLLIALVAAVLGFGGIAGVAIELAKIVFFVAIALFLIAAVVGLFRGRTPNVP
jgi:uncharacterized membrane protein YtjA (UPF0391 family)